MIRMLEYSLKRIVSTGTLALSKASDVANASSLSNIIGLWPRSNSYLQLYKQSLLLSGNHCYFHMSSIGGQSYRIDSFHNLDRCLRKVVNIPHRSYFLKPRQDEYIHFGGRRETFWDRWWSPKGLTVFGIIFGGCGIYYYVHLDYAPYTGRRRMIDLTRNQEVSLGTQQFRKVLAMEASHVVPSSHPLSVRILRIGQRLAKVADQKDFHWEFVVIDKPVANAFCLPGGKVVVYTGLLPITPTDDALASVLAHEIGHAVARHGAEKLAFMKVLFILQFIVNIFVNTHALNSFMINILANLPFSRKLETEADYIGLHLMAKACYDPREAPHVFERIAKRNVNSPPEYLSTHPADKHRVERLQSWLPQVLPEYEEKCPLKPKKQKRLDDFSSWFGREGFA
ncbi:Mitochondrial metalloendopeptidase OMA1 [Galdieria sulphuraria]|uniref:Metallopeptidase n=1 Tax=Galdieria sulphuraria TaxID=130081 RepID=M2XY90_GALSU|nr:metallopeptidase [Galdieria sulphuraria]EME28414.1 metallopeptidase [Galdieria sulphuraria]GJD12242.1 Mitochondrial metalloendopeptidase OMA1 [Galdieria sulphuraria]|eukprot:XP_005704934.1 metallopeptidase [Galdieria sulphuraria]